MPNEETRTLFVCDAHDTAGPIIERLRLKHDPSFPSLTCFSSADTCLVESRGGRVETASAVAFLLGRLGHGSATRLFHVGAAVLLHASGDAALRTQARVVAADRAPRVRPHGDSGAVPKAVSRPALRPGSLVLAHRVVDEESGRSYIPDILFPHGLPEGSVETSERRWRMLVLGNSPAAESSDPGVELADGELSGFCAAALTFLSPHQLFCLCAVVGPGGGGRTSGEVVGAHLDALEAIVAASGELCVPEPPVLDEDSAQAIARTATLLKLTAAERAILRRSAEAYLVRRGSPLPSFPAVTVGNARERSEAFERIRRTLCREP